MTSADPSGEALVPRRDLGPIRAVGIGASAGGVAALKTLFHHMAPDSGLAFVVISHLAVGRESSLATIIQAQTEMPVVQASDDVELRANHVYVIAPGGDLILEEGGLRRVQPEPGGGRAPIDRFLRSLADGMGRLAACVILSGTGADGTLGLKRIKEAGGLAIVQTPEDAEYDTMPRSALATGLVDLVLPVADIAVRLGAFGRGAGGGHDLDPHVDAVADTLRDILTLVRIRSGHDFGNYKRATLLRRVSRRMQVCQTDSLAQYHRYLREHPAELAGLLRDFLISVTNFFRDPDTFAALDAQVIPRLFAAADRARQVRIWVPGCATGEEAYSLAILCAEHAERLPELPQIQIFATDIDEEALAEARAGRYPDTIAADVSAVRLERFFVVEGHHYRVRKELRELVLFSPHNLLRDPPFSKLDLVSCRNLLIYLNREAQDRVLGVVHFALRSDGTLLLGSSESAESAGLLFAPLDGKHRIYTRRPAASPVAVATLFPVHKWQVPWVHAASSGGERAPTFGELHHKLVEHYAPPSVLVNEELDVVHVSEHGGRYLGFAGGEPTRHLLRLIHPGLRLDLRAALYAARRDARGVDTRPVRFEHEGKDVLIQLTVRAIDAADAARGMLLILFEERDAGHLAATAPEHSSDGALIEPMVRQLEDEVHRTRDQLRTTVEQYETTVEELKASNEELHAINEELRSATEELETGKEELQSVNEELTTLNHELKDKIDEVSRANSDLHNLMTSTDIGVLFLDRALHIKRFTPRAQDVFNVIASDVGRPLAHLTHRLECDDLTRDASQVLHDLQPVERDLRSNDGRRYLSRLHPYRSVDDRIEGVVLTFVDVTELKQAEDALRGRDAMLHLAERAAEAGIWDLDVASGALHLSDECLRLLGLPAVTSVTVDDWLAQVSELDRERVASAVRAAIERGDDLDIELRIAHPSRGLRWLWHLGKVSDRRGPRVERLAGITVDITDRRRAAADLLASEERFRQALRIAPVVMLNQDRELRYTWGYQMGGEIDFVGKRDEDLFPPDQAERLTAIRRRVLDTGVGQRESMALTIGGVARHYDLSIEPIRVDATITGVCTVGVDVTSSKAAELLLRDADRRKDEFLATLAHELRNPLAPLRAAVDIQKTVSDAPERIAHTRDIMDRQLEQIVRLVDDLLDVARITQGKVQLRRTSLDVRAIIDAALEAVQGGLEEAGHSLEVSLPDAPLPLDGDYTRLVQAVTNLISNAIKYTPAPGRIALSVVPDDAGPWLTLSVRDSGMGMTADDLPHVFDMYAQGRDELRSQSGLGIGLTLVSRIVELHGGTIAAHSDGANLGSEFVVRLPTRSDAAVVREEPAPPRAAPVPRSRRVLVVDDNPDITDTVCDVLGMIGYQVRPAADGASALRVADEFRPDVVLLDLGLPDITGLEVARALRARPYGGDLVLVALTGWGQPDDLARTRAAGFDHHLVKPAGLDALRRVIESPQTTQTTQTPAPSRAS